MTFIGKNIYVLNNFNYLIAITGQDCKILKQIHLLFQDALLFVLLGICFSMLYQFLSLCHIMGELLSSTK